MIASTLADVLATGFAFISGVLAIVTVVAMAIWGGADA